MVSLNGSPLLEFEMLDWRSTQAAIDGLLGIDYDAYIRTVILGHKSTASFLSSSPWLGRELIEALLGLSALDRYEEVTRAMIKEVNTDLDDVENDDRDATGPLL